MRDAERGITSGSGGCCWARGRVAAPWNSARPGVAAAGREDRPGSRDGGGRWKGHGGMPSGAKVQVRVYMGRDGAARETPPRCAGTPATEAATTKAGRFWPVTGMRPWVVQQNFGVIKARVTLSTESPLRQSRCKTTRRRQCMLLPDIEGLAVIMATCR
jgi:hypothetical protein